MTGTILTRKSKRTSANMIFAGLCAVLFFVLGAVYIVKLLGGGVKSYLTNAVYSFALSFELLLLCLIFVDIRKSGRPFTKGVILKLRIMSLILIAAGFMPSYVQIPLSENEFAVMISYNLQNMLVTALGVVVWVISQVFVYGRELQEDNDLIA